jgi:hypothetical protein
MTNSPANNLQMITKRLANLLDNLTLSNKAEYERKIDDLENENLTLRNQVFDLTTKLNDPR